MKSQQNIIELLTRPGTIIVIYLDESFKVVVDNKVGVKKLGVLANTGFPLLG